MILTEAQVKAIPTKDLKGAIKDMNGYLEKNKSAKIVYVGKAKSVAVDNFIKAVNASMKEGKASDLPETSIDFFNEYCSKDGGADATKSDKGKKGSKADKTEKSNKPAKKGKKGSKADKSEKQTKGKKDKPAKKEKDTKKEKAPKVKKTGGVVSSIVKAYVNDGIRGNKEIFEHLKSKGIDSSPSTISHVCCVIPHVLELVKK